MRKERRCDIAVVAEQVTFRDPLLRPVRLVEIGKAHDAFAPSDLARNGPLGRALAAHAVWSQLAGTHRGLTLPLLRTKNPDLRVFRERMKGLERRESDTVNNLMITSRGEESRRSLRLLSSLIPQRITVPSESATIS